MNAVERYLRQIPFLWFLITLACVAFLVRLARIGSPNTLYFDEIFFVPTAAGIARGEAIAYSPHGWEKAQVFYEWTHPPLSKLFMALGALLLGNTPLGLRFPSVVFGTAAVVTSVMIARRLRFSIGASLLAGAFVAFEGLSLSVSRIAMGDACLTAFVALAGYFIVDAQSAVPTEPSDIDGSIGEARHVPTRLRSLYFASIALGLAGATKWSAFFLLPALAFAAVRVSRSLRLPIRALHIALACGIVPTVVYVGTYAHYFVLGYSWSDFVKLHVEMFTLHSTLREPHPYASTPLQWVFNLKPTWWKTDDAPYGYVSHIYNVGNSIVLVGGFVATVVAIGSRAFGRGDALLKKIALPIALYLLSWLPFAFSPRPHFFYNYAPAVPFLAVVLAGALDHVRIRRGRAGTVIMVGIFLLTFGWFSLFYARNTGIPVSERFNAAVYERLPGWK